ncbi:hypothetical protein ACU4GI_33015 [Cupriavidus basilensis]
MGQHVLNPDTIAAVLAAAARHFCAPTPTESPSLMSISLTDARQAVQDRRDALAAAKTPEALATAIGTLQRALDTLARLLAEQAQYQALTGARPEATVERAHQGLLAAIAQLQHAARLQAEQGALYTMAERENDSRTMWARQGELVAALDHLLAWEADAKVIPLRRRH